MAQSSRHGSGRHMPLTCAAHNEAAIHHHTAKTNYIFSEQKTWKQDQPGALGELQDLLGREDTALGVEAVIVANLDHVGASLR